MHLDHVTLADAARQKSGDTHGYHVTNAYTQLHPIPVGDGGQIRSSHPRFHGTVHLSDA